MRWQYNKEERHSSRDHSTYKSAEAYKCIYFIGSHVTRLIFQRPFTWAVRKRLDVGKAGAERPVRRRPTNSPDEMHRRSELELGQWS